MGSSTSMSIAEYLIFIVPFAVTIILVFGMKYRSAALQARARLADDAMYRELAARAVAAQEKTLESLTAARSEIASMAASLAAVEKILSQV